MVGEVGAVSTIGLLGRDVRLLPDISRTRVILEFPKQHVPQAQYGRRTLQALLYLLEARKIFGLPNILGHGLDVVGPALR